MINPLLLPFFICLLLITMVLSLVGFQVPLLLLQRSNLNLATTESTKGPAWTPGQPCPHVIHAYLREDEYCLGSPETYHCRFDTMETIHSALTHCPDVEELIILLATGDCTSSGANQHDLPFHPSGKDRYPNLRSLKVSGYRFGGPWVEEFEEGPSEDVLELMKEGDFDMESWEEHMQDSERAWNYTRQLRNKVIKPGSGATNLALWLEAMDWGKLEELSIDWERSPEADVVSNLPGRVKHLKRLEITNVAFIKGLQNDTLTSLRWVGRTKHGELEDILAHQGQSLRNLEYRCDESACPSFPKHVNILSLPAMAPQLEHISINMPRNGSWPFEDLKMLSRMPKLQTAELYFRMQSDCYAHEELLKKTPGSNWVQYRDSPERNLCRDSNRYESPFLNHTTAAELFSYIRKDKRGSELQSVTFLTGDWGPPNYGYMGHRRGRVKCSAKKGKETCKAENEAYWKGVFGLQYEEYEDEKGGTWWSDIWLGGKFG